MNTKKIILTGFIAMLSALGSQASTPSMSGNRVLGEEGSTAPLNVKLFNDTPLRDFQMNLSLPEGISIAKDSKDNYVINVNEELAPYHSGIANFHEGLYKIVVSSTQDAPIESDGSVLVSIPLVLEAATGEYSYAFSTVYASQDLDGIVTNVAIADFGGTITVETPVAIEDYQFYCKKTVVEEDATSATLAIAFKNPEAVTAFAFEIELPEGVEPVYNDEAGDYLEVTDRIPSRFDVYSELVGRVLTVEGATIRNTSIAAGDDVLLTVELTFELAAGSYPVKFINQSVTLADETEKTAPDFTGYLVVGSQGPSSLQSVTVENADPAYYDLQGRRVEPSRGIYVTKGRKVLIRNL